MEPFDRIRQRKKALHRWRFVLCMVGFVLFLSVLAGLIYINAFELEVEMNGPSEMILEFGEDYVEQGAKATLRGRYFLKDGTSMCVQTRSNVDQSVTGDYDVEYSLGFGKLRKSTTRTVRVVDTVAPEIILLGDQELFVLPGTDYMEPGFSASDNYDGDLTASVEYTAEEDCVVYRVSDQAGNTSEVKRSLIRKDDSAPEIKLHGENPLSVMVGSEFHEPGFSANDNYDGDITAQVEVSGTVDTGRPGEYSLKYAVQDSFGNGTTVYRSVSVVGANAVETVIPEGKVIYLTFDDGPSCYTEKLLEILERYDVKATFFVVNTDYSDLIANIVEKGHSVGIHSATHSYKKIYASESAFVSDLQEMQNIIFEMTGVKTFLMRFPGGSSNTVSKYNPGIMTRLSAVVGDMGFQYFDWNVDSGDASTATNAAQVAKNVISGVKKKDISIVLQHDSRGFSVEAVEEIIKWGQENGYAFMALSPDSPCVHHGINN